MYPSQTSLIPVLVNLTRHIEGFGFSGDYPYWYLGTTPTKFLTGPVIPLFEIFIKKVIINVSYFDITIYLIILSYITGVLGWFLFSRIFVRLNSIHNFFFIFLLLFSPWRMFYALTLSEPTLTIARNMIPWVLFLILKKRKYLQYFILSFVFLINTSVLPILLAGILAIVSFSRNFKNIKKYILPVIVSLLFVTIWYGPSYWWTILSNPSLGGASGVKVILNILNAIKNFIPVVFAIIAVWYKGKKYTDYEKFVYIWVFSFLFLTIFRFFADWDFWMDWSFWFYELEIGFILLFTINKKYGYAFLIPLYTVWRVHQALGSPEIITNNPPLPVAVLEKVKKTAGNKRVFLSGSTVFWSDGIYQLRGGRDQLSIDTSWYKAAYEFREGKGLTETKVWLEEMDIQYVLVHTEKSGEYYHDFKNIDKWERLGEKVWEDNGDRLYNLK